MYKFSEFRQLEYMQKVLRPDHRQGPEYHLLIELLGQGEDRVFILFFVGLEFVGLKEVLEEDFREVDMEL